MSDLRNLFDKAVRRARDRNLVSGKMGRLNSDGTVTLVVNGRPQWVHIRLGVNGSDGNTIAKNLGVALRAHMPVLLEKRDGVLTVVDVDHNLVSDYYFGSLQSGPAPKHTHAIGSGNEYEVEALRLQPARVKLSTGMVVALNAFWYWYNGSWAYFAATTLDLTSYQPATTAYWRWVVVGVDLASNTATASGGPEYSSQAALTDALIVNVDTEGMLPCAAIQVAEADTALNVISRYRDVHEWISRPDQSILNKIVVNDSAVVCMDGEVVWQI